MAEVIIWDSPVDVLYGDPEDPNGGARSADLLYRRGSYRHDFASDTRRTSREGLSSY